mgnify:CR=1 FL=1
MDIGFAQLAYIDGGKHAGGASGFFKGVLHGHGVHHGGQHAHVVGVGTVHALGRGGQAAEDVAAADDQGEFHAQSGHFGYLPADELHGFRVDAGTFFSGQSFAAQLEKDALVLEFAHRQPRWDSEFVLGASSIGQWSNGAPQPPSWMRTYLRKV